MSDAEPSARDADAPDADADEAGTQWVVYMHDENGRILPHFLAVCDSWDDANDAMTKWWKAFYKGEKEAPRNYGGLSFAPVTEFEEWTDGEGP